MKFITITATVVKRITKDDGSMSIRLAKIFGTQTKEDGSTREVMYKDCWLPFRWNTKNGSKDLTFVEAQPEEVQVWNDYNKCDEVYIKRFTFYIPEWLQKSLKPLYVANQATIFDQFMPNDNDPYTIIENKSADNTESSRLRSQDLGSTQTEMFDGPIMFDDSSLSYDDDTTYNEEY